MVTKYNWYDALEDYYDTRLTPEKAQRWMDEIKATIPGITEHDIITALKARRDQFKQNSTKARPDLTDVIALVRSYRGDDAAYGQPTGIPNEVKTIRQEYSENAHRIVTRTDRTTMAELKFTLKRCEDPVEAWEIITTPQGNTEQCKELEAYARTHGIAYERFIPNTDYDALIASIPF